MTKRDIKNLINTGAAEDITNYNFNQMNDFLHSHDIEKIGTSSGVYGMNGGLLMDRKTGKLYAIAARNSALFMAF